MTTTQSNATKVDVSRSKITLDKINTATFQKEGTKTAQIRQVINTVSHYPSTRIDSNLQGNMFTSEEFGFKEQVFNSIENRVAFLLVPENWTEAQLLERIQIANDGGGIIYRVLSNQPILDENQLNGVRLGLGGVTLDTFADRQVSRYPIGTKDANGNDISGKLILDKNGKVQYRRTFYWGSPREDYDARTADANDTYATPKIKAELAIIAANADGAASLQGQSILTV